MNWDSFRLAHLTLPAKLLVTLFLALIGPGYLFGPANAFLKHQDADLEPGMSLDDLRRSFHGMEKTITPDAKITVNSVMLEQVRPGGGMRKYLERGGEPAIRGLITWLEAGAMEENFARPDLAQPGDLSAKEAIAGQCVECHTAGGDMEDLPFATAADGEPEYAMVIETATPEFERFESGPQTIYLAPTGTERLVHVTHAHILTIPVFTLLVGGLFLMTGLHSRVKLLLGPLPMLAILLDISSWWIARVSEPFIYVIAGSGALFGAAYGLQILAILTDMWLIRAPREPSGG